MASSVVLILLVSGIVTALGGLAAFFIPGLLLRAGFGVESADGATMFIVRHWCVLIFAIGALVTYSAYRPVARPPILAAAALEKFAVGILLFSSGAKPRPIMWIAAATDAVFASLYVAYLAGL